MFVRVTVVHYRELGNFYAVSHIMVADASMLSRLSPFATIILTIPPSRVPGRYQVFCPMLMTGALFVIKPGFWKRIGMASWSYRRWPVACRPAYTMVRMLGSNGVQRAVIVFCFSAFSCPAMGPDSAEIRAP